MRLYLPLEILKHQFEIINDKHSKTTKTKISQMSKN